MLHKIKQVHTAYCRVQTKYVIINTAIGRDIDKTEHIYNKWKKLSTINSKEKENILKL